jgi:hypothetical protein
VRATSKEQRKRWQGPFSARRGLDAENGPGTFSTSTLLIAPGDDTMRTRTILAAAALLAAGALLGWLTASG